MRKRGTQTNTKKEPKNQHTSQAATFPGASLVERRSGIFFSYQRVGLQRQGRGKVQARQQRIGARSGRLRATSPEVHGTATEEGTD
ncbi:hypothetical protein E2C01_012225 [Portunus trituberculatus]|uniref:Uncharacterized protein n=1 Tax=Portunus trituberculatus TaxID=210409 RepID=A0A5B7DDG3_PORTR|nr:hypothetical protein [Portunus trituberculatus]